MFNRSVSKWYVVLSVLYVLLGVIMLFWPHVTVDILGVVLGVVLLAYGAARIVIYFTKNHFDGIVHMDLTVGVVFGALGGFMLLHRDFVNTVFPFAVAILLLIGAISKLQYALDMKRIEVQRYKVFMIFAVIVFVLGIILSLCVEITGSLYSSMILHFLINSRSVALLSSEDMVNSMLTQSSTQPVITAGEYLAGAAVYTPVVILCIAGIWWSLKRLARSCGREDLFRKNRIRRQFLICEAGE